MKREINYAEENRCKPDLWSESWMYIYLYVEARKDIKECERYSIHLLGLYFEQ